MAIPTAQDHVTVSPGPYTNTVLGYAQLAITGTAQTLNQLLAAAFAANPQTAKISVIPPFARFAFITIETAGVRWIDDGQAPTPSFGQLVGATQSFDYSGDLTALQLIAVSGAPLANVSFYK